MVNQNPPLSPQITIVEASAGSGKTYCLAGRYIRLLMSGSFGEIPLKNILAITFSNKAAFEMKERILEFLKMLALDKFPSRKEKEDFLSFIAIDEEFAGKKARLIMDEIVRGYNFFQVQTIDSFINAILSGCAFKFHLTSAFRIKHNYTDYLSYSLDRFIDQAATDPKIQEMFSDFLEQYIYLENKKGWLPKPDILSLVESLFVLSNVYGMGFKRYAKDAKDLLGKKERIVKLMGELKKQMPDGVNMQTWGSFMKSSAFSVLGAEKFFLPFAKDEFKMKKGFPADEGALRLWKEIKDEIAEFYIWRAYSLFNCYIDIFTGVLGHVEYLSRKEDVLFLLELNSRARKLFEEGGMNIPELYYRLAAQFRHFLIDEFQDTSLLQWENLFPMVSEALSTGGSLFYVGDKKQAIYRFRGGEVSLIDELKTNLRHFNPSEELLDKNYRSQLEIVEFNNQIFSQQNLLDFFSKRQELAKDSLEFTQRDIEEMAGVFAEAHQVYKKENTAGFVKFETIEAEDKEDAQGVIKDKVLDIVSNLKDRFAYSDIALLARSNAEVELFSLWLIERGIPVESEKTLNIRENPYIKELVSFLKFLNSPIDNLSFASFILGDIFSRASGIDQQCMPDFIFGLNLKKKAQANYLYIELRQSYPEFWSALIEEFFKNVGLAPLYELVVSVLAKFKVMENFPKHQGFFMKFLELIKVQEEDNQNLSSFLEFFESNQADEIYVNACDCEAVKVLTIHKSKGLEFGVVVIPFLEINIKPGAGRNKSGAFTVYPAQDKLALSYLVKDESLEFSAELKDRYVNEYKKALIDELNAVYVAFTRAKYELYVFTQKTASRSNNLAGLLIPEEKSERGERISYKNTHNQKPLVKRKIALPCYQDWISFLKDEFEDESLIKRRQELIRGDILHFILSGIGNLSGEDLGRVILNSLAQAKARFSLGYDWAGFEKILRRILEDENLKPFFFLSSARVFQEKELVDRYGRTKRIDRLIVRDDEFWVIDYKSSKVEAQEYQKQVLEYTRLLKDLYPGLSAKGFIIYLDSLEIDGFDGEGNKL
ncbi:MAG: UvrD-helicase domain-containing protein [Candidatus Omnitrophota bacterium]